MQDTYKIILDSYAKRLITTNSRTRTIYYSKNNKYIIDMARFINMLPKEEFKNFFSSETEVPELKFTYGAMSTSRAYKLFDKLLSSEISEEEFIKEFPLFTKSDIDKLKKEKKDCYVELYNKYEKIKRSEIYQIKKIK